MSVSSVSTGSAGQLWGKINCPQHRALLGPDSHRRQGTGQESGLQQGCMQLGCRVAATLLALLSLWTRPSFCDPGARTTDSAARSLFSVLDGARAEGVQHYKDHPCAFREFSWRLGGLWAGTPEQNCICSYRSCLPNASSPQTLPPKWERQATNIMDSLRTLIFAPLLWLFIEHVISFI